VSLRLHNLEDAGPTTPTPTAGLHIWLQSGVHTVAGVRVAHLACGSQHCLVLTAEGELYACGNNSHGELGVGDTAARPSPTRLDSLPSRMRFCAVSVGGSHANPHPSPDPNLNPSPNPNPHQVSAGGSHSLCIEASGAVLSWGHGGAGRLGHGDVANQTLPKRVDTLVGSPARLVCGGGMHSLMVAGERLYACGYKGDGRLGLGGPDGRGANIYDVGVDVCGAFKPQPVDVGDLIFGGRRLRQIACGDHHRYASTRVRKYVTFTLVVPTLTPLCT